MRTFVCVFVYVRVRERGREEGVSTRAWKENLISLAIISPNLFLSIALWLHWPRYPQSGVFKSPLGPGLLADSGSWVTAGLLVLTVG